MNIENANQTGLRITGHEERMTALIREREEAEERFRALETEEREAHERRSAELKQQHTEAGTRHTKQVNAGKQRLVQRWTQRHKQIDGIFERFRGNIMRERQDAYKRIKDEVQSAQDKVTVEEQAKVEALTRDNEEVNEVLSTHREKGLNLKTRIQTLAGSLRADLEDVAEEGLSPADNIQAFFDKTAADLSSVAVDLKNLSGSFWLSLGRRAWTFLAYLFLWLAHGAAAGLVVMQKWPAINFVYVGGAMIVTTTVLHILVRAMRGKAVAATKDLYARARHTLATLDLQEQHEKNRYWNRSNALMEERIKRVLNIEKDLTAEAQSRNDTNEKLLADYQVRYQRLKDKLTAQQKKEEVAFVRTRDAATATLKTVQKEQWDVLKADYAQLMEKAQSQRDVVLERTARQWKDSWIGLEEFSNAACLQANTHQPPWPMLQKEGLQVPADVPRCVTIGRVAVPIESMQIPVDMALKVPDRTIELPLALSFPVGGSLLVRGGANVRPLALDILFNAALRIVTSIPPGMAKLTMIDPLGLGKGFSALMQLRDHDETLVSGRIWTESSHIEKRLAELTEHMEKIIQNYLRNRYTSLEEYNKSAGQMKEPYHFILLSDFPTGLSDLAMERLASIVNSGAMCGVHVLMYHDSRQPWPEVVSASAFKNSGVMLLERGDTFVIQNEGMDRGRLVVETPPETAAVNTLLDTVGKRALEAKRVELSFETAVPNEEQIWSRSADKAYTIPIGWSGGVKMQELSLGRGTAQHALIAGRTGSGKSTLFHVLITNTALWYSPKEVEFYLIDFKKGVEFKAYAQHRLPHARVIAIESDREFGLSVLKRLDRELDRRGELFREAGVQDLAAYRKSPNAEVTPRTLLLIDEFQEYFTEDDAVSQEAALLLDRFVRQGRAFGVHAILGSQTLSGVYSLAKSTLGQMGVRIALQCNESDSYLILSEDNAAARLLSRPGEAIYNDQSGLVEGNSPFQVVWLPDEVEANYLKAAAARAEAQDAYPKGGSTVFEGNAPARLENNVLLQKCVEDPGAGKTATPRVWLGEPNAIKGPTEIGFEASGGSHLLMVGQRKDLVFGMFSSAILSLTARYGAGELRLLVLDGSSADSEYTERFAQLDRTVPHEIEMVPYRDIPELIETLEKDITEAQESARPLAKHTFLFVFGLQRFRALRQEDDFSFGSDSGASTGDRFANLLRDGPENHLHTCIWCDTLANTSRAISRKSMREFDMRVLFQMSAADSSELIDAPTANTLGLHNALLYIESEGTLEKFRPYAWPEDAWLDEVREVLRQNPERVGTRRQPAKE